MDFGNAKERLVAAQTLLHESSSSFEKFKAVKKLIHGLHPHLDQVLAETEKKLTTVEHILGHDYVVLGIENLPDRTEEQKKRKDAIMFFWRTWNELRGEVARVQMEFSVDNGHAEPKQSWNILGRLFSFAVGPFGIITIAAILLVLYSSKTSVDIMIHNNGCPTLVPSSSFPNWIPGIKMPNEPIVSGQIAKASLPSIPLVIEDLGGGKLIVSSWFIHMNFQLAGAKSVVLDNRELLKHRTEINLGDLKVHDLAFNCR